MHYYAISIVVRPSVPPSVYHTPRRKIRQIMWKYYNITHGTQSSQWHCYDIDRSTAKDRQGLWKSASYCRNTAVIGEVRCDGQIGGQASHHIAVKSRGAYKLLQCLFYFIYLHINFIIIYWQLFTPVPYFVLLLSRWRLRNDLTNSRAYATVLCPSVCLLSVFCL